MSICTSTYTCDQRRDVFASLLKSKKFSKIHIDWGFNLNSKKLKIVIKFSQKDAILTPLHVSTDHHVCRHQDRLMASVWHPDKSEKISNKLPKIACQMWNVIIKTCFIQKAFVKVKDSPNLRETRYFCMHVRDFLPFSNFSPLHKFQKKYISYFEM